MTGALHRWSGASMSRCSRRSSPPVASPKEAANQREGCRERSQGSRSCWGWGGALRRREREGCEKAR
eukprot:4132068-Prymnesium_polylepis.1